MIYLDNAASTQMSTRVINAMKAYMEGGYYGNPDSRHAIGLEASRMVEGAREVVAKSIGARPDQIVFTSGGTEANNLAIKGCSAVFAMCSEGEHDSVYQSVLDYDLHCVVKLNSYGQIDYDDLASKLDMIVVPNPLLAFTAVNNEIGTVNNISKIVKLKPSDAWLHIDYVQAFGQFPIDVSRHPEIDSLSISSHKVHGPQGVGALYVKSPERLSSILSGAKEQEFGLRPGTKNVLGIVGFGTACADVIDGATTVSDGVTNAFVECLNNEMESRCGGEAYDIMRINGEPNPKIVNISFKGVDAETLIMALSAKGVCVSAGSACHANTTRPSRVLKAIGVTDEDAMSTIRVSFSSNNTQADIVEAARIIAATVTAMR